MEIAIRPYEERDRQGFIECLYKEQVYLVALDPFKRFEIRDGGAEKYAQWIFSEIAKNGGIIYVALDDDKVIGMGIGFIHEQDEEGKLCVHPTKPAEIQDLYVDDGYRSQGIGAKLVKALEEYFKSQGRDEIWVGALTANGRSVTFYEKCGYKTQFNEMLKKI